MIRVAAWTAGLRLGLYGAVGCLAGAILGEAVRALAAPADPVGGAAPLAARAAVPTKFRDRLEAAEAEAGSGDVEISLAWDTPHDLDLHCIDPQTGENICYAARDSRSGGRLDVAANTGCEGAPRAAVENIVWAAGTAPAGTYQVFVHFFAPCPREVRADPARADFETKFQVRVRVGGEERSIDGTARYALDQRDRFVRVHDFEVRPSVTIEAPAAAGGGRTPLELPFRLTRAGVPGPATVTATNLPSGLTADPVVVPPGESEGTIHLSAAGVGSGAGELVLSVTAGGQTAVAPVTWTLAPAGGGWWRRLLVQAVGMALPAIGLAAGLVVGRNRTRGRRWSADGALIALALAAGLLVGGLAHAIGSVFALASVGGVGLLVGWLVLGAGLCLLPSHRGPKKTILAGLALGGISGAIALSISLATAEWAGRMTGALAFGFLYGAAAGVAVAVRRRATPAPPGPRPVPAPAPPKPAPPKPPVLNKLTPAAGGGNRCPSPGCGRPATGAPGQRYCLVCDRYF